MGKTGTNLDYANTLRLVPRVEQPRDEYMRATWDMIYSKMGSEPETWLDRLARRFAQRLIALLLRDPDFRRRLCLVLAAEMRAVDEWLDKPVSAPPAPPDAP